MASKGTPKKKTLKPKKLDLPCYFCGGALRKGDAWFEIHDQELPPYHGKPAIRFNEHGGKEECGGLAYPGSGEALVADRRWRDYARVVVFAHTKCGPDIGYNFSFDRLNENWEQHLREKVWWSPVISEALEIARSAMAE
jgi:hypothetical protein